MYIALKAKPNPELLSKLSENSEIRQTCRNINSSTGFFFCKMKNSGSTSPTMDDKSEEMSLSVLSTFRAKEEEIEKKKMAVKELVQAQLGRVEEESKRLADIREELEALQDPMRKEVALLRKRIDTISKEIKPLGITCQKKEREYREFLDAYNEKSKEKSQLVAKLMEMVGESEKMRMKKLDELSKHIESLK